LLSGSQHTYKDATCRFVSVRAGRVSEVSRFMPVRVNIRLRVTRFALCVSEMCLRVMRVGIRVTLWVFCVSPRVMHVACHACRVSRVPKLLRVVRVACHACLTRLRFGSCPYQVFACLRFVFVFAGPCKSLRAPTLLCNNVQTCATHIQTCANSFASPILTPKTNNLAQHCAAHTVVQICWFLGQDRAAHDFAHVARFCTFLHIVAKTWVLAKRRGFRVL
jgi:hypothetical protein